jgi:hypothetical protein
MTASLKPTGSPLGLSSRAAGWVLALILVSGLAVRLPSISTGAFVFHSGRQFNSALLARNYELGGGPSSADVDQRVASAGRGPLAEPPLLAIGVAAPLGRGGAGPACAGHSVDGGSMPSAAG